MLRDYQSDALKKLLWDRSIEGNAFVVLPQGAGKSHLIAEYAKQINEPVLIFSPNREVLTQNREKLVDIVGSGKVAVYSAALNSKSLNFFTFATIQSVYKKPGLFKDFKTVVVDECDKINVRKLGMYTRFLKDIGSPKCIGLTATPYRRATRYRSWGPQPWQKEAYYVTELINRVFPAFWSRLLHTTTMQELIDKKFLVPNRYIDRTVMDHRLIPLNKGKSEFDLERYWKQIEDQKEKFIKTIDEALAGNYKSILVFCVNVQQAMELHERYPGSEIVTHKTPKKHRARIIEQFKNKTTRMVFNVETLTVGFDHPELDCIILGRPTRSLRLYNQMVGRGSRPFPGKDFCTVYDLSGNVKELGTVESFRIEKIDGKWDIVSDKGRWHNKTLYSFKLPTPEAKLV